MAGVLKDDDLAVRALYAAATELEPDQAAELARRITEWVVICAHNRRFDMSPGIEKELRLRAALRSVAEVVGEPPNTVQYQAEYERRRSLGDTTLPAASTVLRHFDGWPYALAAAGLMPAVHPNGIQRRRTNRFRKVHRFSDEHCVAALRDCAAEFGRTPVVPDYIVWRDSHLQGRSGKRSSASTIPSFRTIYRHFGSWPAAIEAAGLDPLDSTRSASLPADISEPGPGASDGPAAAAEG